MELSEYLTYLTEANTSLGKYDEEFVKSIEGWDEVNLNEKGKFYTLMYNGKKAGLTGVIIFRKPYFQVAIHQDFRGKGLVKDAADLIAKKHKLKELVATIEVDNVASIGAHKKAGFRKLTPEENKELRVIQKPPKKKKVRFIKEYK